MTTDLRKARYRALLATPKTYRVMDAIDALDTDLWTTKGRDIRAGDRVLIWKAKGQDECRGIVALGEVLTDPESLPDAANPFWLNPPNPDHFELRVRVRYFHPPNLPIWLDESAPRIVRELACARATGGTVFHVRQEQWDEIVALAGGWPDGGPV